MVSLLGYGAHGRDIEALAWRCGVALDIYDDNPDVGAPSPSDDLDGHIVIGINSPSSRRQIAERFRHLHGCHALVDPTAIEGHDIHLGRGVVINPFVSLLRYVTLGDHVHVNTGVQMVRTTVGDYSTISPGVVICGNVEIGHECWIGAGAVIADRVQIDDNVIVAAGAIIPPESIVPANSKVIGVWKQ